MVGSLESITHGQPIKSTSDITPELLLKMKDLTHAFQSASSGSLKFNAHKSVSADGSAQQKDSEQTPVPSFGKMSDYDEKHGPIYRLTHDQHKQRNTRSLSESSFENGLTESKRDEFNRVKSTKKSA